jgi:predicted ribosomally synthesized peptide with SipW-like signal peptide
MRITLASGYEPLKTAGKAVKSFIVTSAAIGGMAVLGYFTDSEHIKAVIGASPLALALLPLLTAAIRAIDNYWRHRND